MDPQPEQDKQELSSSWLLYALLGALGGFALAVVHLIDSNLNARETYPGARGALWLGVGFAGMFLGTIMANDVWKYGLGGALLALSLLLWMKLEGLSL